MSGAATSRYRELLAEAAPRVIRSAEDNERAVEQLEKLSSKESPTQAEKELIELLAILIEDFEEHRYAWKAAKPVEVLATLMEAQGLRQKDLVDVFRTPSIVSEVMNGKRELTVGHIRKLAKKFHTSPAVFI